MNRNLLITLVALFVLSSCVSKKEKDKSISISGAFALYPMTVKWAEEYKKENQDIRFNISGGGAGKGMADALAQTVDIGMFSREISQSEIDKGAWWIGLCKDAVLPTISADNPYLDVLKKRGITPEELYAVFVEGKTYKWSDIIDVEEDKDIVVYTRSDACGAAGTWAKFLKGSKQEDLKGIGVHGDPALAEAVGKDLFGIGYNNTAYVYDIKTGKKYPGIEVIPIDLNGDNVIDSTENFYDSSDEILKAIANGDYPSPPARELYFVSKGKPTKQTTLDFMKWVLTDGQKFVKEAGYVPILQEKLDSYLKTVD